MAWKPWRLDNSIYHGAFPTITAIMYEALNLKVFQQSSLGVFKITATDPKRSNPKHAHRMDAELAPDVGWMVSGRTQSVCSECVLVKATCPAGRKNGSLVVKSFAPQVQILLLDLSDKLNHRLWRIMGCGFLNLACRTLYKWVMRRIWISTSCISDKSPIEQIIDPITNWPGIREEEVK